jgi:hypothetical protein
LSAESIDKIILSYAQLLGLSAVISGGVSALINYWMNLKDFKKKSKIKSLEGKISLYSYFIFQLDKMRFHWQALDKLNPSPPDNQPKVERYVYPDKDGKEIFDAITRKIEDSYSLFKQETLKEWVNVSALFFHPSALESVPKLRKMLIDEYNNEIIPEYEKMTGARLERKV